MHSTVHTQYITVVTTWFGLLSHDHKSIQKIVQWA